jgi:hypothetical protein
MTDETSNDRKYLTRRQAAQYLTEHGFKTSNSTLAKWACWGTQAGPPFRRWGRQTVYEPTALLGWARAKLSGPATTTSEHEDIARRSVA